MPKQLMGTGTMKVEWREYEERSVGPGEVRVSCTHAVAKHGTEMAFFRGYANPRGSWNSELQLFNRDGGEGSSGTFGVGNMFVGPVVECGSEVKGLAVGDTVFGYGSFRESHVCAAEGCMKLERGVSWQSAVCIDPAVFAMGGVRDGNVRVGDRVAVFGLGAIGLMVVQLARLSGASMVIAVDPVAMRRKVAAGTGADLTLDSGSCDVGREIKEATGGAGVDVAVEFSGAMQALQHAIRGVAFGGTVVCGAFPAAYPAGLDLGAEAHMNRPNVLFSRACSDPSRDHPRWDEKRIYRECLKLINEGRLVGEKVVQPVVPFASLAEEYPKIATEPDRMVKLGVSY